MPDEITPFIWRLERGSKPPYFIGQLIFDWFMVVSMDKLLHKLVWPKHHHYWDTVFYINRCKFFLRWLLEKNKPTQTLGEIIIGSVRDPFGEFMIVICCHLLDLWHQLLGRHRSPSGTDRHRTHDETSDIQTLTRYRIRLYPNIIPIQWPVEEFYWNSPCQSIQYAVAMVAL